MKDDQHGGGNLCLHSPKEGEKTTAEETGKAFCKGKVGASIHPKHHRVAQFSNNLCLPTCQPTAHRDPAQPHALSPLACRSPTSRFPVHRFLSQMYSLTVSGKVCKETRRGREVGAQVQKVRWPCLSLPE